MSLGLQGIHIRFQEKGDFLQGDCFISPHTVFLLAVLEKQNYGVYVSNTKFRFADITVIRTVYIQMSFKKKSSKFTDAKSVQIRTLIFFL